MYVSHYTGSSDLAHLRLVDNEGVARRATTAEECPSSPLACDGPTCPRRIITKCLECPFGD